MLAREHDHEKVNLDITAALKQEIQAEEEPFLANRIKEGRSAGDDGPPVRVAPLCEECYRKAHEVLQRDTTHTSITSIVRG
jgi:hypothetical protein